MNNDHNSAGLLLMAWLNYFAQFFLTDPLHSLALVFSIFGSISYIALNVKKLIHKKNENNLN